MKFLIDSCKLLLPSTKPHSTGTKKTIEALSKMKWGQTETHLLDALVAVCLTPEESHKTLKERLNGLLGTKVPLHSKRQQQHLLQPGKQRRWRWWLDTWTLWLASATPPPPPRPGGQRGRPGGLLYTSPPPHKEAQPPPRSVLTCS